MTTTAAQICDAINALDMARVAVHFNRGGDDVAVEADAAHEDDDFADMERTVRGVCRNVSVDAFNEYAATEEGEEESLRIPMRCLQLDAEGRLLIVEYPISTVHESTARCFSTSFEVATGDPNAVAPRGSMTATQPGRPDKEADATFGPKRRTPHRSRPPPPRTLGNWETVAVEVGHAQSWESLLDASEWWFDYVAGEYHPAAESDPASEILQYALFDTAVPVVPGGRRALPPPTAAGTIHYRPVTGGPPANITFDMRRVLAVPAPHLLPVGVNPQAVVDLRQVIENMVDSVD